MQEKGTDFNAEDYAEIAKIVQIRDAVSLIETFDFSNCKKVLDLGSGDGQFSNEIAKKLKRGNVYGLDISKDMVKHAMETNDTYNLSFIHGDVQNISNSISDKFDLIFSNHALHWVYGKTNHLNMINSICNHLEDNGHILFCFSADDGTYQELFHSCQEISKRNEWNSYFYDVKKREFPMSSWYELGLKGNQLKIETFEKRTTWMKFESVNQFATWIKTSLRTYMAKIAHLSEKDQFRFATDVADYYVHYVKSVDDYPNDSKLYLRSSMLFIHAIK